MRETGRTKRFVAVVGHGPELQRDEGAIAILRALGADARGLDLWEDPSALFETEGASVARALVVEAMDRPDLAVAALRGLRRDTRLAHVGALVALTVSAAPRIEPSGGFDDFVLSPYVPTELYARVRMLEWRRSEFANEERVKIGAIVIDRSAHEVVCDGYQVALTSKEFALLAFLAERRGKVVSREELLAKVWSARYEGGERTVDIHVRRLRAKLGSALPLMTLRGSGYKLALPDEASAEDEPGFEEPAGQRPQKAGVPG